MQVVSYVRHRVIKFCVFAWLLEMVKFYVCNVLDLAVSAFAWREGVLIIVLRGLVQCLMEGPNIEKLLFFRATF